MPYFSQFLTQETLELTSNNKLKMQPGSIQNYICCHKHTYEFQLSDVVTNYNQHSEAAKQRCKFFIGEKYASRMHQQHTILGI
jgi:hypothetical protein